MTTRDPIYMKMIEPRMVDIGQQSKRETSKIITTSLITSMLCSRKKKLITCTRLLDSAQLP